MSDEMPLGWNEPAPASLAELVETLEDVLEHVRSGDSFEGFVEWTMATPDPCERCHGAGQTVRLRPFYEPVTTPCVTCEGTGQQWRPGMKGADVGLRARYRVGNLDGQGGLRVFEKERQS